jgi:hypothetical protein
MRASQRCREKMPPLNISLSCPMCVHNPLRIKYFHEALAGNVQKCLLKPRIGKARCLLADRQPRHEAIAQQVTEAKELIGVAMLVHKVFFGAQDRVIF